MNKYLKSKSRKKFNTKRKRSFKGRVKKQKKKKPMKEVTEEFFENLLSHVHFCTCQFLEQKKKKKQPKKVGKKTFSKNIINIFGKFRQQLTTKQYEVFLYDSNT